MALAASLILAASCVTASKPTPPNPPPAPPGKSEADIVADGATSFSEGRIDQAQGSWSAIPDSVRRDRYLAFAQNYLAFEESVAAAEKTLPSSGPEAAAAAVREAGPLPAPPEALPGLVPDPLGAAARLDRVGKDASIALVARATEAERAADADLAYARTGKDKDPAAIATKALEGFAEAGRLFYRAADWIPEAESDARRTAEKADAAVALRRRLLRESLLAFPDRMGEVFARSPSPSGHLGDKELLAFNAETSRIISSGLSDFDGIVAEYPDILDPDTLKRLRDSARGLAVRFSRIESTIKSVKDRGKPLIPIIIGIFNPQPGDPQRSRPASFAGRLSSGSDWWWGIADIPKGLAQDLVITLSDSRPVRVYAAGLGSSSKRPASDLVNPLFKVGNSWPVLNAGARLEDGVFHIEVGPARAEGYTGEAVVYKSFMTRTR